MTIEPVKRIEVVIDQPHLHVLIGALRRAGADGWTVVREVSGSGGRGEQWADDLSGSGSNVMVLIAAAPPVAEVIVTAVEQILRETGGLCLISDAKRLRP